MDIGRVRTGIAVSDPNQRVASALTVIATAQLVGGSVDFQRLIGDYQDITLLAGLPVSMDGKEHAQAAWVRETAEAIASRYQLPVVFYDERRSTAQAEAVMREMGYNARTMRGKIDMVAASIFLQGYLDSLHKEDRL